MANITAADVSKLRQMTGAGMMDCKKALVDAEGNFEKAKELIRERGLAIANKRADKEASEGVVFAKTLKDNTMAVMIALNCETDFVAKNQDFINLAKNILEVAANNLPANLDELKTLQINGQKISDLIIERSGVTGEKMELAYYAKTTAPFVSAYIHNGSKIATIVGLNKIVDNQIGMNIAMHITAMNPVAIDKDSVTQETIDKEREIGREQARNEGKAENMLDKIAEGKLQRFFKDYTLLNQDYSLSQEGKITVKDYLEKYEKGLTVTDFKRYSLSN